MTAYATSARCRMAQLRAQLDDPDAVPCGRCDACAGAAWVVDLPPSLVADALTHLRRGDQVLEPRLRWAGGGPGLPTGNIPARERVEPGRILSVYGDGGWGHVVREVRATGVAPIELLDAAHELVRRWSPSPWPTWITSVPSTTSTVPGDLAIALGAVLGLPVHDVVVRVADRSPQAAMENSTQQLTNVHDAFDVIDAVPAGPVLLVDDVVDSRWTITVVGSILRRAGAGEVHPFVLARARG